MIGNKSMIERVYRQAQKANLIDEVIVATDDFRIFDHVKSFGGKAAMTKSDHQSGTDRCAEVAAVFSDFDYIINIQGDEPFISPDQINALATGLKKEPETKIATLAKKIGSEEELFNPNVVKVVFDLFGQAIYFSRHPIPYFRDQPQQDWLVKGQFFKHIGMYGFKRQTLLELSGLKEGRHFLMESLEQLKWIENGYQIRVWTTTLETIGIDTPDDLNKALNNLGDVY